MSNINKTPYIGVGIGDILQIVLIVLKLCGVIDWSWWWVLSPTWIVFGVLLLCGAAATAYLYIIDKKE